MNKLKKTWKVTQVVTIAGLVLSGVYVANEIAGTTDYYKAMIIETAPVVLAEKPIELTEEMVLTWLDQQAEGSQYVEDRIELARQTFKESYKVSKLDTWKYQNVKSTNEELAADGEMRARVTNNVNE